MVCYVAIRNGLKNQEGLKPWSQKVVSINGLKDGLKTLPQRQVSRKGFNKWSQEMVSKDEQEMVSNSGLKKSKMVSIYGLKK